MAIIIPGTGATGPIQTLTETVKNTSGGTLLKGTPVRITGATGQEANVGPADASTAFPANFVLAETLAPGESGQAVALGFINNVPVPNASLFTAGQEVYLAVGGGWTTTRPTGAANIQLLGNIVKVNTGTNTISGIFAPQNIEYLPNLTQGKVWVGSAAGVPEESDPAFSGQIINGVAHFVETTAPTFRKNAAGQNIGALVAGDKWYKPTDGAHPGTAGDWIWNGLYWLTSYTHAHQAGVNPSITTVNSQLVEGGFFNGSLTSVNLQGLPFFYNPLVYLDSFSLHIINTGLGSNFNANNRFDLYPALAQSSEAAGFAVTVDSLSKIHVPLPSATMWSTQTQWSINTVVNLRIVSNLLRTLIFVRNVVGSPAFTGSGTIGMGYSINVRGIHP